MNTLKIIITLSFSLLTIINLSSQEIAFIDHTQSIIEARDTEKVDLMSIYSSNVADNIVTRFRENIKRGQNLMEGKAKVIFVIDEDGHLLQSKVLSADSKDIYHQISNTLLTLDQENIVETLQGEYFEIILRMDFKVTEF